MPTVGEVTNEVKAVLPGKILNIWVRLAYSWTEFKSLGSDSGSGPGLGLRPRLKLSLGPGFRLRLRLRLRLTIRPMLTLRLPLGLGFRLRCMLVLRMRLDDHRFGWGSALGLDQGSSRLGILLWLSEGKNIDTHWLFVLSQTFGIHGLGFKLGS